MAGSGEGDTLLTTNGKIDRETAAVIAWIICTTLLITAALAGERKNSASIHLEAVHASVHVSLTGSLVGSDSVSISCARNEVESFQIIVRAEQGRLHKVDALLSPLKNRAGDMLAEECCSILEQKRASMAQSRQCG